MSRDVQEHLMSPRRARLLAGLVGALLLVLFTLPAGTRQALLVALLAQRNLLVLLLGFSLLTISLLWATGQRLDALIFLFFHQHHLRARWLDVFMFAATQMGNGVLAIIGAILFYFTDHRRLAIQMLLGLLTLWLMVELMKAITDRARPFYTLEETRLIGWRERGRSFPSGHTAQTFFLMALLIYYFQLGVTGSLLLYGMALLVGFTRIYMGVHYPRDVLAGAVLGAAWGILATLIDPYLAARLTQAL
jgi:membrane-associated phospholipid phosphatase